jgi:hypothetical protein
MVFIEYFRCFSGFVSEEVAPEIIVIVCAFIFSKIYSISRAGRWREILSSALDYHRFHLDIIMNDTSVDVKNKELVQAMIWAVTRQIAENLKNSGGGALLFRSLFGEKTALNTCGAVFYDIARNFRFIDHRIVRLNTTLTSTFYRIYSAESFFSGFALLYMDLFMLKSFIFKPAEGSARLYLEMRRELKNNG